MSLISLQKQPGTESERLYRGFKKNQKTLKHKKCSKKKLSKEQTNLRSQLRSTFRKKIMKWLMKSTET
jgi:hypothetical protein